MEQQQNKYISALDIGTSKVIALIGEIREDNEIHIVGLGQSPSRGLRAGMVTNIDATAHSHSSGGRRCRANGRYQNFPRRHRYCR